MTKQMPRSFLYALTRNQLHSGQFDDFFFIYAIEIFFGKLSTVRRLKRSHMTAINQVVHRPDREKGPSLPKISDGQVFEKFGLIFKKCITKE